MSSYAKGARLERLARRQLEQQGCIVVRAAGSKGPIDLVALSARGVRLIQVKARGASRPADLKRLRALAVPPGATREVWERTPEGWDVQLVRAKRRK